VARKRPKPSDSAVKFEQLWGEAEAELATEQASVSLAITPKEMDQTAVESDDAVMSPLVQEEPAPDEVSRIETGNSKESPTTRIKLSEADMRQFSRLIRHPARFSSKTSHSVSIMADDARAAIEQLFHAHGISPLDSQHLWNIGMIMLYVGLKTAAENDEHMEKLRKHYDQAELLAELYSVLLNVTDLDNPLDFDRLAKKMS
jgi:hypothetical protein